MSPESSDLFVFFPQFQFHFTGIQQQTQRKDSVGGGVERQEKKRQLQFYDYFFFIFHKHACVV